jgi:hypothetical protein
MGRLRIDVEGRRSEIGTHRNVEVPRRNEERNQELEKGHRHRARAASCRPRTAMKPAPAINEELQRKNQDSECGQRASAFDVV